MKYLVIVLLSIALANNHLQNFEEWKIAHNKIYKTKIEHLYRYQVYVRNTEFIEIENAKGYTYTLGQNQFMDLTKEEFVSLYLGQEQGYEVNTTVTEVGSYEFPDSVDHTKKLNPIKNQGSCGAGWAFAAAGVFEAFFNLKYGKKFTFSEQYLIDCDTTNFGCNGGQGGLAIDYINKYGAAQASDYPWKGQKQVCKDTPAQYRGNVRVHIEDSQTNIARVKEVAAVYAVSVSVDASEWQFYTSGIYSNCQSSVTNHVALIVGYTKDEFWKIRNSWGTTWGESGHIRLKSGNTCGVLNNVDYTL